MSAEIKRLPGVESTPPIMLGMLQHHVDKIESLVVIVRWREPDGGGSHQVTWTAQSLSSLAMATVACQQVCGREIVKV